MACAAAEGQIRRGTPSLLDVAEVDFRTQSGSSSEESAGQQLIALTILSPDSNKIAKARALALMVANKHVALEELILLAFII